ncbi:MAG: hypothetical protein EXS48_01665 [Candidatus Staskawiczbacteria bacterium]|nr:hypothetical protein [Candidatus Staskawiczbacteria bacterium]
MENRKLAETLDSVLDPIKKRLGFYSVIRELHEDILPKVMNGSEEEKKIALELLDKKTTTLLRALESEVHATSMESFDPRLHTWVFELISKIIEESSCTTELEKAVATVVASTHIRFIDNSKRLNDYFNDSYGTTKDEARYLEVLSKQTDRAHRQFLNSVMVLKQLKAPLVEMNIKTMNAFVAQNQQINVDKEINEVK